MIRFGLLYVIAIVVSSVAQTNYACAQTARSFRDCTQCNLHIAQRPPAFWAARDLLRKEQPELNMHQRFPYRASEMSYYRRPYNAHTVSAHRYQAMGLPTTPYSNQMYKSIHEMTRQHMESEGGSELATDGYLEYVDWQKHRNQRLIWNQSQPGTSTNSTDTVPLIVPQPYR